jgi:hypothetical protein
MAMAVFPIDITTTGTQTMPIALLPTHITTHMAIISHLIVMIFQFTALADLCAMRWTFCIGIASFDHSYCALYTKSSFRLSSFANV